MHAESTHTIYFTLDFARFKNITGNRVLNEKKISKIIKEIQSGFDMLPYCPIIVDEQMNVIDGQHRLAVAMRLNTSVYYVISKTISLQQIAKLNTNTERWKMKDFVHCYSEVGMEDYKQFDQFLKKYQFPRTMSIALLKTGKCSGNTTIALEEFEAGKFKCNGLKEAEELAKLVYKFKAFDGFLKRNFIMAIEKVMIADKCDIDALLQKFQIIQTPLLTCNTTKEFMVGLETIYNHKNSIRRPIF